MMKKWLFFLLIILISVVGVWKLLDEDKIRVGNVDSSFEVIKSGSYEIGKNLKLADGKYAIYAVSGQGEVNVNGKRYYLDVALYNEAKKQPNNTRNSVIYEESPKINIDKDTLIEVSGNNIFSISFMKR